MQSDQKTWLTIGCLVQLVARQIISDLIVWRANRKVYTPQGVHIFKWRKSRPDCFKPLDKNMYDIWYHLHFFSKWACYEDSTAPYMYRNDASLHFYRDSLTCDPDTEDIKDWIRISRFTDFFPAVRTRRCSVLDSRLWCFKNILNQVFFFFLRWLCLEASEMKLYISEVKH